MRISGYLMVLSLAVAQPSGLVAQERPPIIDMHLHAQNLWTVPGALEPLTGLRAAESTDDLQAMTFAALDAHNVVLAVASGPRAEA